MSCDLNIWSNDLIKNRGHPPPMTILPYQYEDSTPSSYQVIGQTTMLLPDRQGDTHYKVYN
jgi:hypothetical protein